MAMLEMNLMHWTYAGRETSRLGSRAVGPWFIADCADGKIFVLSVEEDQWQRLVEFMGNPDWAAEEIFHDRVARGENMDVLKLLMSDWLSTWKVQDLYREAQERRIPFAPVNTMEQMYENEHLAGPAASSSTSSNPALGRLNAARARRRSTARSPGRCAARRRGSASTPTRSSAERRGDAGAPGRRRGRPEATTARPARSKGCASSTSRRRGPARSATQILAHLGAEVIRIETTTRTPCVTRLIPPFADDQPGPGRAGYFNQYNQGKRSILLDLRKPEAVALAYRLVEHCDVVADNFSAGVMNKLGFGYETLRAIKPDIIQISMSGYGQSGPFRAYLGYGPPAAALSGLFGLTGYRGGEPAEIGMSYPDPNAGLMGAYAVMVALLHRDLTGEGQYIDQSQWEAVLVHMGEGLLEWDMNHREPRRAGNHDRVMSPHETYKARGDDNGGCRSRSAARTSGGRCVRRSGSPSSPSTPGSRRAELRKENEAALDEIITDVDERRTTAGRSRSCSSRRRGRVPVDEQPRPRRGSTPRSRATSSWSSSIPRSGDGSTPASRGRCRARPAEVRTSAPMPGADTDEVLGRILGLSSAEIERLRAAEIVN